MINIQLTNHVKTRMHYLLAGGEFLSQHLIIMDHSCFTLSDLLLALASIMNIQAKISVHLSSKRCCMVRAKAFNLIKQT